MIEIRTVDFVHQVDAENCIKSSDALDQLMPGTADGIETIASALNGVTKAWSESHGYSKHHAVMEESSKKLGLKPEDALGYLRGATLLADPKGRAKHDLDPAMDALRKSIGIVARTYLSLRVHRDFLFGMSDLHRLRLTSAVGYLRVQSETAGLLKLTAVDPGVGREWLDMGTTPDQKAGKAFHDKWHPKIVKAIEALGLKPSYTEASNAAMHSRPGGVVRGILAGSKLGKPGEVRLNFQEVDDYRLLLFALAPVLRFHCKILEASEVLYPELTVKALAKVDRAACYKFADQAAKRAAELWLKMGKGGVLAALSKPK